MPHLKHSLLCIFAVMIILSCKQKNRFVETRLQDVDLFLECMSNNTPDKILEITDTTSSLMINDKEFRDFYVAKAYKLIKRFGLPTRNKWIIRYDPKNNFERLSVTIPLFKGYDSILNLVQAEIVVAFPPPQIGNKIYKYEINEEFDRTKLKPTLAVPSYDSTKTSSFPSN